MELLAFCLLHVLLEIIEALGDLFPVHHIPPRFQVIRPAILISQIISVFPYVVAHDGKLPSISGESWLAEEMICSAPLESRTSQAQPLPKRFTPASLNFS